MRYKSEFYDCMAAEFGLIEAYDCGQYEYTDAYRHCFRVARALAYGWQ